MLTSRTQLPLATASVGPVSWRDSTIKEIKFSQAAVERSDKRALDFGRTTDPLPSLRDNCVQQSNTVILAYVRETRAVLVKLRENFLETNEEIKSLIRGKESLEKKLDHVRKDIALNKMSTEFRSTRPSRERCRDGADQLLEKEVQHLYHLKKSLETKLREVQKQLQVLDMCRKRLNAVLQERNRVLDLLCHGLSSVTNASRNSGRNSSNSGRASRQDRIMTFGGNGLGYTQQLDVNMRDSCEGEKSQGNDQNRESAECQVLDPLGPFTPEVAASIAQAKEARQRSVSLRKEIKEAIETTDKLQSAAHQAVNGGLNRKVAETVSLQQHLQVALGENRHAVHRAQRWYDATEKAQGYTVGPELQSDLETKERLTRPLVRVYQRHPGTNLPEAQDIIKGAGALNHSLMTTSQNIALMRLASSRLQEDIRRKKAGASVDSAVVRMRRRLANHRWVVGSV